MGVSERPICRRCGNEDEFTFFRVDTVITRYGDGDVSCFIEKVYRGKCKTLVSLEASTPRGEIEGWEGDIDRVRKVVCTTRLR